MSKNYGGEDDAATGLINGERRSYGGSMKTQRNLLISSVFLLVVTLAIAISVLVVVVGVQKTQTNDEEKKAQYPDSWNAVSTKVLGDMNMSANPCDDFYTYTCGGWLARTPLPADKYRYTRSFSVIDDKNYEVLYDILQKNWPLVSPFFTQCGNDAVISNLNTSVLNYNGFVDSILGINDSNSIANITARLEMIGVSAFFEFSVDADSYNSSINLPMFNQGGISLTKASYSDPNSTLPGALKNYIFNLLTLYNSSMDFTSIAQKIVDFETQLANISLSPAQLRDPVATYNKMPFANLTSLVPNFNFPVWQATLGINLQIVDVLTPAFFGNFSILLSNTDLDTLQYYLFYKYVDSVANLLPKNFRDTKFNFTSILTGQKQATPDLRRCADATLNLLPDMLARVYVERTFSPSTKDQAEGMLKYLSASFSQNIADVSWMTAHTKTVAQEKLASIREKIGYPATWDSYSNVQLIPDSYFFNTMQLTQRQTKITVYNKINAPVDRTAWLMTPATVNAYYNPPNNEIVFPAAILQPSFYDPNQPQALNFGGIGVVIGHEMTHGFDDQGRQYDKDGNLAPWWAPSDVDAFKVQAQCIVDQYSRFFITGPDGRKYNVDGENTLGENIADNGGIRESYRAYQNYVKDKGSEDSQIKAAFNGLTAEQLFFVAHGQTWCTKIDPAYAVQQVQRDPHSPGQFRVAGPVQNFKSFADAFNCPAGSNMNPQSKCSVW